MTAFRTAKETHITSLGAHSSTVEAAGLADKGTSPIRALDLLAMQPVSLVGLTQSQRDQIVVSAICDDHGKAIVVSRLGDATWDLSSDRWPPSTALANKSIKWPKGGGDASFVNDIKAAVYVWMKQGESLGSIPQASSVYHAASSVESLVKFFRSKALKNFSEVEALHISDEVARLRKKLQPISVAARLKVVDLVWRFRDHVVTPMLENPWGDLSRYSVCFGSEGRWGSSNNGGMAGSTPVIPLSVQRVLFNFAEEQVASAARQLSKRDAGKLSPNSLELLMFRHAVMYLVQVTSGMRVSELAGIKNGCWRTEEKNGVLYYWVATVEHKTNKGLVDFLVPREVVDALTLLQRYAKPLQDRLKTEIEWLTVQLNENDDPVISCGLSRTDALQRLQTARESVDNLFLGLIKNKPDHTGKCSVGVVCAQTLRLAMQGFARMAGVKWKLSPHQCRRTFAYTVANSRLGRKALIFLKWQLHHSTIEMSQLYAANPNQDQALYEEVYAEMVAARCQIIESWLEEGEPLSGGAGRKILQTRATAAKSREELLELTADTVSIRSTGHSWCLAERGECIGEGVHEAARCANCSSGVIDSTHREMWEGIHLHNKELLSIKDCGPAVLQRANRIVVQSAKVLTDLGMSVDIEPVEA